MPTYEYNCPKCGNFEASQRITEDAFKTCPTCGSPVERLISATAFHLKGGGWYKTDYASSSSSVGASNSSTPSATESKSETPKVETPASSTPAPTATSSSSDKP